MKPPGTLSRPFASKYAPFIWIFVFWLAVTVSMTPCRLFALTDPRINTQPQSQSVLAGSNAVFTVVAGGQTPFHYQWSIETTKLTNNAHISGATNATLTVSNVTVADASNYLVVVSNSHGNITSSNALLTVLIPAGITNQPASQTNYFGGTASFSISAQGTAPLIYHWYFNSAPLSDGGQVTGSTNVTLNISGISSANIGNYQAIVTNNYGSSTSIVATLSATNRTLYVNLNNSSPEAPYTSWSTAATNIQDAVDGAFAGDQIFVTNGDYTLGSRVTSMTTNCVVVTNAISISTVSGPAQTTIDGGGLKRCIYLASGAALSGFTLTNGYTTENGGGAWCGSVTTVISNCVIVSSQAGGAGGGVEGGALNNCVVNGNLAGGSGEGADSSVLNHCTVDNNGQRGLFLTFGGGLDNGFATNCDISGNFAYHGGGAHNSTLVNCTLNSDSCGDYAAGLLNGTAINCTFNNGDAAIGGGAYGSLLIGCTLVNNLTSSGASGADTCTLDHCILMGNESIFAGGGAANSSLNDCLVVGNSSDEDCGGIANCTATNCTIVANSGSVTAGGASASTLDNCIVYFNGVNNNINPNYTNCTFNYSCTTPMPASGTANIATPPLFVNQTSNNFHLYPGSPCINTGNNAYVISATDLDGNARIVNGTVDMGAYEFQAWPFLISSPTNQTAIVGQTVSLNVAAAGNQPLNVQWYFNGAPLSDNNGVTGSSTMNLNIANVQLSATGNYYAIVTNSFGSVTSAVAVLTVVWPPVITSQPVSESVVENQAGGLSVTATGGTPLSYQWYFTNGSPVGFASPGFVYIHIQPSNAGSYYCVITNVYGSVTSEVASLTVLIPPQITMQPQPQSQTLAVGANIALSAAATGTTPLGYQWYFNNNALTDGGRVSGSASANLMISNSQTNDSGTYFVVVTNAAGTAISSNAAVSILQPPSVTSSPASQTLLFGSNVTFTATASGSAPLTYEWFFNGQPLSDGGQFSGTATTALSITNIQATNGGSYTFVVTNPVGSAVSTAAVLTVLSPPTITQQPLSNPNAVQGTNFVLSATAIGTASLAYQWYFNGNPLTDGGRISGSMTSALNIAGVQTNDAGPYQLIVTNDYGSATSIVSVLTVQLPVVIQGQPTNQTVLAGNTTAFTVTATGFVPPNYLWYSNGIPMANGGRISGANSATLTISNTQTNDDAMYQAIVTNIYGSATSSVATLTVIAPVQILSQPVSQDALFGTNITFTVTAGGTGPLNYQWYFNGTPLSDGGRITGSASSSLAISTIQSSDAGAYRVVASNLFSSAASLAASLTPQSVLGPSIRYVMLTSTNPLSPYLDWSTAATNIQDAADAAVAGDSIIVSNGNYNFGGRLVYGTNDPNRVVINKPVTVESLNGAAATAIIGFNAIATHFIPGRCAYLTNGAILAGFTLTSGGASTSGDMVHERSGGGAWCETGAVISNCVIVANTAPGDGGGVFGGTLLNCLVATNTAQTSGGGVASNMLVNCELLKNLSSGQIPYGGGAFGSTLSNCLLVANSGVNGGGAAFSLLTSCTVSNNTANVGGGLYSCVVNDSLISSNRANLYGGGAFSNILNNCVLRYNASIYNGAGAYISALNDCTVVSNACGSGGGIWGGTATNSIIYYNFPGGNTEDTKAVVYSCTSPSFGFGGATYFLGDITNTPMFVNLASGDFHLQSNSPCINSGKNAYVTAGYDFDGNPRIAGGTVDIGAYEYQTPSSTISYAYLQQYGLPTDGSVDSADLDGTAFNVYQDWLAGLNPTNSTSVLAVSPLAHTNNANGIIVTWQSVSTRNYYVQRATNLAAQTPFSTIQSNIAGHAGAATTSYTDTSATNSGPYYYRVGAQQQ